ncbi:dihydrofolate reductase family protein [Microbacterium sp. 2P01SA-2]|uniref:dihydrofolate reductase family protein n=1 Tax=unclassified Microbacterium TaxID=2609290 RepID=UPI0039A2B51B
MRDLVYYVAASIDGFIADPDGGFDAFATTGEHDSVVLGEYADALPAHAHAALGIEPPRTRFDTVVMGWNTLTPALDAGIASPYPHLRQIVASRQAREVDASITLTADPLATVRSLKGEDGLDVWLCGGGQLAGALLPEIDRVVVKRHPVVFGAGIRIFGGAAYEPRPFSLARTCSFKTGVVIEDWVSATGA